MRKRTGRLNCVGHSRKGEKESVYDRGSQSLGERYTNVAISNRIYLLPTDIKVTISDVTETRSLDIFSRANPTRFVRESSSCAYISNNISAMYTLLRDELSVEKLSNSVNTVVSP